MKEKTRKVYRGHKDRLFCDLFSYKENALSLYNAINGTAYENVDELEIVTLTDVVYLTMKNDAAVCFQGKLDLWEQQSSVNENMPLRGFMYFAREYEGWLAVNEKDIYGEKLVQIPTPGFYILYNGSKPMPERKEYRLSDAFETFVPGYEWTAHMININAGYNKDLMKRCTPLKGYSQLIENIRQNQKQGMKLEEAVNNAIDQCIEEDILKSYLLKNKGEVMSMILTEYNEKLHNKTLREEGREEGHEQGLLDARNILRLHFAGKSSKEISEMTGIGLETVKKILDF